MGPGTLPAAGPEGTVHAQERRSGAGTVEAPDFPPGMEWLNVARPLTMADLRGKAVLLDFWTYGCINCLHNVPGLLRLQEEFRDELVIIGVHSAKFPHEAETDNIRRIAARYGLNYPIVNDRNFVLFTLWGARAWPTLVLIDPAGRVVGAHAGEGVYEVVRPVLEQLIAEFDEDGRVDRRPLELVSGLPPQPSTVLAFPGKVLADPARGRLFVADTHHHRIVVADVASGQIQGIIGSGEPGFEDGPLAAASFRRPQGMALSPDGSTLYVADSGNHAVRRVALQEDRVETVVGTGRQATHYPPLAGTAPDVELNSPWDLVLDGDTLYVAMAGSHQVWTVSLSTGDVRPLAGNGWEGTADGLREHAELAQPMGITFAADEGRLYFVDTEGSSVRWADVGPGGQVGTLAGSGASLFDFGDADGEGREARFQHPRGITYYEGMLYVADTYNGKIKRVDPRTGQVTTLLGSAHGWRDGDDALFYEPNGIHAADGRLYVADTNNHLVRIVDLETMETTSLVLWGAGRYGGPHRVSPVRLEPARVEPGTGRIVLDVRLPEGYVLNDLAPSSVSWRAEGDGVVSVQPAEAGTLTDPQFPVVWDAVFQAGSGVFALDLDVLYCLPDQQGLCFIEQVRLEAPFEVGSGGSSQLRIGHTVALPQGVTPPGTGELGGGS